MMRVFSQGHAVDLTLSSEPMLRLTAFLGILAAMALWEIVAPRRPQTIGRTWRWPNNLGVVAVDTIVLRILFPTAAVGVALLVEARGFGLMNVLNTPALVAVPLCVVLLDLAIYAQHVGFHHVPALWRLHRMHHADLEVDVTTGVRFHPVEIILSMLIK